MSKTQIIKILKDLRMPESKYLVTMGASLAAHDIRLAGDIDIIFDRSLKEVLEKRGFKYESKSLDAKFKNRYVLGKIEAFDNFYNIGNFSECIAKYKTEIIGGIQFMSLEDTLKVKALFGRRKDMLDCALV